jgi:hypothetical protein
LQNRSIQAPRITIERTDHIQSLRRRR